MTDHWLRSAFTNDVPVAELLIRLKHSSDSDSDSITTFLPPRWGHRKYRSKSTTAAVTTGGKEHRGSPTTHLSWSGGGGGGGDGSSSDGYDESGGRSVKVNEGASTSNDHKFDKGKVSRTEQELTSMRVSLNQQLANCENIKRIKIDLDQNQRNKMREIEEHVQKSCRLEVEIVAPKKGFVLPDLNMTPNEEDPAMMG